MSSGKSSQKIPVWDLPDLPKGELPPHLELQRTRVSCTSDAPIHTESIQYSGAYASIGVDNSLRLSEFRKNFKVEVISLSEDDMEFDLTGIDVTIANALRRILIAELPTMAIEKVFIAKNTSVVQDEVLSHTLGLVPLKVDPRHFNYMSEKDEPNEKNTIVFKLHARNEKGGGTTQCPITGKKEGPYIDELYKKVRSKKLKWLPNGSEIKLSTEKSNQDSTSKPKTYTSFSCSQDSMPEFANNPIAAKHGNILLAKLGPKQEIELEAHAVKGMGKTHAKWSPVGTAWYRMLPEIVLLEEIVDEKAEELVKKCPKKVFDIEDIGKGCKRATVARPRSCTLCRECIKGDWKKLVAVRRVKDHFIFKIESTGALPPEVLFTEAVKILEDKCERVISEVS
ncbi:DNA-directed RNA polymerases I and III subunit rpac1-like [Salvia hispanica]|uniref:DNA-directed RNA polymerases I and III subunit rpac1-like n=1 Tax=Salvia hispanica TaxID=49212 RepID=UPI0020090CE2|nr:DNA-directed RNA polymerases I and III subunit rpac1-like [Salvia hispanica]